MTLLEQERATYEDMWAVSSYATHSPGQQMVPVFLDMAKPAITRDLGLGDVATPYVERVLDAGCGSGKGALALEQAGFRVELCDLTPAGLLPEVQHLRFTETVLWDNVVAKTGRHDWVYCCDVLEHIPTPFTMLVVSRLLAVAKRGVFLTISTQPDAFGAWVGKPLHQTVQSFVAWRDQLGALATMTEARDCLTFGAYLLTPKAGTC